MLNTEKLRKDVNKKIDNWNERSQFTLAGVKNLSRSDMDVLLLMCDLLDEVGADEHLIGTLILVSDDIMNILKKYGWEEE